MCDSDRRAEALVEHYTRTAPNAMRYEATIEDPEMFQRPWTIRVELALHSEPKFRLIEHECDGTRKAFTATRRSS